MDVNPYAPPTAVVADQGMPLFKRRSVVLMILLMVISFGLYVPVWFLRRRDVFNQLDSPRKLQAWPFVALLVAMILNLALNVVIGITGPQVIPSAVMLLVLVVRMALGIWLIVQSFKTRDILEDHLAGPSDGSPSMFTERVKLSGLMTFFFQTLYLQYIINRYLAKS